MLPGFLKNHSKYTKNIVSLSYPIPNQEDPMIYCVEDDSSIRELMLYTLRATGFEAEGFESGEDLFAALAKHTPQLITLDVMLPGMDGIEILKRLRAASATERIPVVMASAKGAEYDKVLGLDLGADDYLAKPFSMMEMVSRIRAVLRRTTPVEAVRPLRLGNIEMLSDSHTVRVQGNRVELTLKEFELLKLLMHNVDTRYPVWGGGSKEQRKVFFFYI